VTPTDELQSYNLLISREPCRTLRNTGWSRDGSKPSWRADYVCPSCLLVAENQLQNSIRIKFRFLFWASQISSGSNAAPLPGCL
jgi:hypothetical protein